MVNGSGKQKPSSLPFHHFHHFDYPASKTRLAREMRDFLPSDRLQTQLRHQHH